VTEGPGSNAPRMPGKVSEARKGTVRRARLPATWLLAAIQRELLKFRIAISGDQRAPRRLQWGAGIFVGVLCALLVRVASDNADASHPIDRDVVTDGVQHFHIRTINADFLYEKWCHWPYGDMTHDEAKNRIYVPLSDPGGWQTVPRVSFVGTFLCDQDPETVYSSTPHFEVYIYTAHDIGAEGFCGNGQNGGGCVTVDNKDFKQDLNAIHVDPGYFGPHEYRLFRMYLDIESLRSSLGQSLVDHEMGHVLGLEDDDVDTDCLVPSIMHGPTVDTCAMSPTAADKASVEALQPPRIDNIQGKVGFLF